MTIYDLVEIIGLPIGVKEQLQVCQENRTNEIPIDIKDKLFDRNTWESGIAELKEYLTDDPYSMKILLE